MRRFKRALKNIQRVKLKAKNLEKGMKCWQLFTANNACFNFFILNLVILRNGAFNAFFNLSGYLPKRELPGSIQTGDGFVLTARYNF